MVGIRGQLKAVVGTFLPGASYFLGETLYLSLTDKCNAATLISTRGPGFRMPEDAAFQPLNGLEPSADQLAAVVDLYYSKHEGIVGMGENDGGVAFAGLGEPTLRLETMLETIALVRERRHGVPFRLVTNGLCSNPINMAQQLREVGLKRASVALMTANPKQYDEIMQPTCEDGPVLSHSDVVATILALSEAGIETEVTAVSSPGVNVADIKQLSVALGADFRARTYHT